MSDPTYLVKINTVDLTSYLKAPSGFKVGRYKLWAEANRNMDGSLTANFIGIFPKLKLVFKPLTETQLQDVQELLDNATFTVAWWDNVSSTYKAGIFYAGDWDAGMIHKELGLYDSFEVSLISTTKLT
jgi:hypothetical protein